MKRPWQDNLPKSPKTEYLDEKPEMMKKIPSEEKRVASFKMPHGSESLLQIELMIIGVLPAFLFFGGWYEGYRRGFIAPFIKVSNSWKIGSLVLFFAMIALINFLGRNEKDRVDIYPEMIVFCDYDPYRKEARPTHFYYWTDIVQYHRKESYIWLESKDNAPQKIWISIKKLCPYLKQYAPHAREVNFNMEDYWKFRLKENRPEDKSPEELAIEAEMAANREKAKEVLANAKDVTAIMEDVEKKRASDEAKKAKDFWNKYPEE